MWVQLGFGGQYMKNVGSGDCPLDLAPWLEPSQSVLLAAAVDRRPAARVRFLALC